MKELEKFIEARIAQLQVEVDMGRNVETYKFAISQLNQVLEYMNL